MRALDPLVGSGRFDFIENLGAMVPMRTIGYLLGIPEENQEEIRDRGGRQLTLKEGTFRPVAARTSSSTAMRCSPTTSTGGSTIPPTI